MLPVGNQEGVHGAGTLQAGHGGADFEGLTSLDGNVVFAAVHNLGHDGFVAQIDVLELGAEAEVDHLRGGNKKRVRSLRIGDSGV